MTQAIVSGSSQRRVALGIINAYLELHPETILDELQKAFPNNLNPDCGSKQIFMTKRDIMEHVSNGEDWYETGRGYFVGDDEWLHLYNGECVGFVGMWSDQSFNRLVKHAEQYGIIIKSSIGGIGSYNIEYIND